MLSSSWILHSGSFPPLYGLDVINSFYRQWPHALYFSSLFGFVSSEVLRNREFDTRVARPIAKRRAGLLGRRGPHLAREKT
jgi:hypothetical protein